MQNDISDKQKVLIIIAGIILIFAFFLVMALVFSPKEFNNNNNINKNNNKTIAKVTYTVPATLTPVPPTLTPTVTPTQLQIQIAGFEECGISGDPVINITQQIVNDYDTGIKGNLWAIDTYTQDVKIWKRPGTINTYCAEETVHGTFDTLTNRLSPGDKHITLSGNEDGTINGRDRVTIVGTLKNNPLWPTTGTVPTVDLKCVFYRNCPEHSTLFWSDAYFEKIAEGNPVTDWYVWYMQSGNNIWIDSSKGFSGDII